MSMEQAVRRVLPYTSIALLLALIYVGWVFFSRWQSNRDIINERKEKEAADDRQVLQRLGGNDLKILSFSAEPGVVPRGGRVLFCYGVLNATTVRIDPHIEDISPALSQCIEAHPKRTADYTITAQDRAGHSVSAHLQVQVQ